MRRKPNIERKQTHKSFFRKRKVLQTCEYVRDKDHYVENPDNHFQGDVVKKVRYRTRKDAKHALQVIQDKRKAHDETVYENRVYRCKQCKGYHLTSQPDRFWDNDSE